MFHGAAYTLSTFIGNEETAIHGGGRLHIHEPELTAPILDCVYVCHLSSSVQVHTMSMLLWLSERSCYSDLDCEPRTISPAHWTA